MQIAVVTPVYRTPPVWLEQCLASVAHQTIPCTHFVVSDGDDVVDLSQRPGVEFLRLPSPHADCGNAARAIGSVSAVVRGFDAIAYLDADNWFAVDHLARLVELQANSGAAVCTCARNLVDLDGHLLGRCPEVDGETFVDTSCLFLTRHAFDVLVAWYSMPRVLAPIGDRLVWQTILAHKLPRAHVPVPTVNYRTSYAAHYTRFGKAPPAGAKQLLIAVMPNGDCVAAKTVVARPGGAG